MRVVLTILDSMPPGAVSPESTPNLWRQVLEGGRAPIGALSLPVSVTYSNHAAFVTGIGPQQTGLWGNAAWVDGRFTSTYKAGPRATTLFDRCIAADRRSVVVLGDHKLVPTMGAQNAAEVWPPSGAAPEGIPLDEYGYPANSAVIDAASSFDLKADFVVLHLNEPDTTLHLHGPDSPEFAEQVRHCDTDYGQLLSLLEPDWDDTVLISISDHQQEAITHPECVDLKEACTQQGWNAKVIHDGTAAIIVGDVSRESVRAVDGVEGVIIADHQTLLAWPDPGKMFGTGQPTAKGNHGSPRCRPQMAIVSGGHEAVPELARQIESVQPSSLTWAPLIQNLLGI